MSLAEDRAALTYAAGLIGHVVRDGEQPQLEFVKGGTAEITTALATPTGSKKFLITVKVVPDE